MNQVLLVGRIKGEPLYKTIANGSTLCHVTIETENSFYGDNENKPELFQVTLWNRLIEIHKNKIKSKALVAVNGHLRANNYDKEEEIYFKSDLIADRMVFL